jgi:hypothetical protein
MPVIIEHNPAKEEIPQNPRRSTDAGKSCKMQDND